MNPRPHGDLAHELVAIARTHWRLACETDPETWCKNAGVTLERTPGIYAGRYLRDPNPKVLVNYGTPKREARFVIAHELAHHLIAECRLNPDMRREVSAPAMRKLGNIVPFSDIEELLCDQFAGVLLLSAATARSWVRNSTHDIASVLALADAHDISIGACVHQLTTAGGFDRTVVIIGPDGHITDAFGQRWPLTAGCRPLYRLNEDELADWGTTPRWLRWTPTDTGVTYSTKATGVIDEAGGATLMIHLVGRHIDA